MESVIVINDKGANRVETDINNLETIYKHLNATMMEVVYLEDGNILLVDESGHWHTNTNGVDGTKPLNFGFTYDGFTYAGYGILVGNNGEYFGSYTKEVPSVRVGQLI